MKKSSPSTPPRARGDVKVQEKGPDGWPPVLVLQHAASIADDPLDQGVPAEETSHREWVRTS